MFVQFIWWAGVLLEALLLVRAFPGKLRSQYPIFYTYVTFILLQSVVRQFVYRLDLQAYPYVYWISEFLGVAMGCAVVFEIYRVGLSEYAGTARMARKLLAFVFAMAVAKVFVDAWNDPRWRPVATTLELERGLRVVEAFAIAGLVALFLFYSIPSGRNLRGILLGYGLFIATSVIWQTVGASSGPAFHHYWSYVNPISYAATLVIWAAHLWSYQANPEAKATVLLERQYQRVAAATSRRLQDARAYLAKAARP